MHETILIVDDDANLRQLLSDLFASKGFSPVCAGLGRDALDLLGKEAPAVAVIDLNLPDMDGVHLMAKIRAQSPDVACIVLTGYATQDSAIEAVNQGAYSYLTKPLDKAHLLLTVRRAVEKRAMMRELLETNVQLRENERLLTAYNEIGKSIMSSLDLDRVLDMLAEQVIVTGVFRSLMVALVDEDNHCVEVVRTLNRYTEEEGMLPKPVQVRHPIRLCYDLNDENITPTVARTGERQVIEEWDDRFDRRVDSPENRRGKVSYFIPVKQGNRVLAVLATGSKMSEKAAVLRQIGAMQPLLDQVAIALEHARLYKQAQAYTQNMIHVERLHALGELSAGISHNLNNILTSVLGPAQLLQRKTHDPDVLAEVEEIIAATRRARDLVHRLHLSTRGVTDETLRPVSVDQIVRESVRATRPRWKDEPESRGIAIDVSLDLAYGGRVRGTESGLHDAFFNLILNAVDAMPGGGAIGIQTRTAGEGVEILVSDTGSGMDEATRIRIFEPFFTTKADVGSGLGLSTVHNAVTRWGGKIEVESSPSQGALFRLWLPSFSAAEAEAEDVAVTAGRDCSGKLLIVEGDPGVCRLLSCLLGECYEVRCIQNGKEAVAEFSPGFYDAVLIDMGIPGMPGDRVAQAMRKADPDVAMVLITGWEMPDRDPGGGLFDFRVQKPFDDLEDLEDVVAQAIALHNEREETHDAHSGD